MHIYRDYPNCQGYYRMESGVCIYKLVSFKNSKNAHSMRVRPIGLTTELVALT